MFLTTLMCFVCQTSPPPVYFYKKKIPNTQASLLHQVNEMVPAFINEPFICLKLSVHGVGGTKYKSTASIICLPIVEMAKDARLQRRVMFSFVVLSISLH